MYVLFTSTGLDNFIAQASFERPLPPQSAQETGKSFAGFTDLHGEILTIPVTKVNKKLGIAIDGGANTKQKAVIIREISVGEEKAKKQKKHVIITKED